MTTETEQLVVQLQQSQLQKSELPVYTRNDVAAHNKDKDGWVIVNGFVYNITEFIDGHPGGADYLVEHLGKDISEMMKDDKNFHKHSPSAYSSLDQFLVGRLHDTEFTKVHEMDQKRIEAQELNKLVDFSQPIVHQVASLGLNYIPWLETGPVHLKDDAILFNWKLAEDLSHTQWYVIPLLWIPISALLLLFSLYVYKTPLLVACIAQIGGFFLWFFIEYGMHKFIFHNTWLMHQGYYLTNWAHFLLHGIHHKIPMDKDRLVMPVPLFAFLSGCVYICMWSVLGHALSLCTFSGGFIGYVLYDMSHYWIHHASRTNQLSWPMSAIAATSYFQTLRKHHMIHHYHNSGHDNNFGISNMIIDRTLHTLLEKDHNTKGQ